MPRIFALLVGINDYPPKIGRLRGCVSDLDRFHDFLREHFGERDLEVVPLKNGAATRANVVDGFRRHLAQATAEDVVLFHYSGHGARWAAAAEFSRYFPDGRDEGLVCWDSRDKDSFDLADKELAVLLAEVASRDPHLAVILDCCHSGSATRGPDDFRHLRARQTHEVTTPRALGTYLGGHYADRVNRGESLTLPTSRHILLSACDRRQKAWETDKPAGVFTEALLEVLTETGGAVTYADLFLRCRSAVRKHAEEQTPQFETYGRFNPYSGFLGRTVEARPPRHSVSFSSDSWWVDCGAIHGLPTDADKSTGLTIYAEKGPLDPLGHASTVAVGPQASEIELDFAGDPGRYRAEITSLPQPPVPVFVHGDAAGVQSLRAALPNSGAMSCPVCTDPDGDSVRLQGEWAEAHTVNLDLTERAEGTRYAIAARDGLYALERLESGLIVQLARGYSVASAMRILGVLKHVLKWETALALRNDRTRMDASLFDFHFAERMDEGEEHCYRGGDITLDFVHEDGEWREIHGAFRTTNRSSQTLYFALFHFSPEFGVDVLCNESVPPTGGKATTLWETDGDYHFFLPDDEDEAIENFKLIVTTEKVNDFLLQQKAVELGEYVPDIMARGGMRRGALRARKRYRNEWLATNIRIRVVRRYDRIGDQDVALAGGQITVRAHDSVTADLSLASSTAGSRSTGDLFDLDRVLGKVRESEGEPRIFEPVIFAGARAPGREPSVLELSDIQNADALRERPLQIDLDLPLAEDECVVPLTFDGEHILLCGDVYKDETGTHISIDYLPDVPDNRRSLGKALKLYFFKTYLKRPVNSLCWVEYLPDGSFERQEDGVKEQVASAHNVLLLMHGIIGDTKGMVRGLPLAKDHAGRGIDGKFDLVLTYDYENLNTPIEETARTLGRELEAVGLHRNDGRRLTVLTHSMGGLVSRWFIEKENGNAVIDHLVMCGTPNDGSPYGQVGSARSLFGVLTTVALNGLPAIAPFGQTILFLLNRSKKVTPTLEQMNASSEFMGRLNDQGRKDPGVPYTILAGDVGQFEETSDRLFGRLLTKAAKGSVLSLLFDRAPHDIAVSTESIRNVDDARDPAPTKQVVPCHHLNYFADPTALAALASVAW